MDDCEAADVRITLGKNIRQRRVALRMSRRDLARTSSTNLDTLGRYERGETDAPMIAIVRIARALECTPNDLAPDSGHVAVVNDAPEAA